jgi:hypothetical protein
VLEGEQEAFDLDGGADGAGQRLADDVGDGLPDLPGEPGQVVAEPAEVPAHGAAGEAKERRERRHEQSVPPARERAGAHRRRGRRGRGDDCAEVPGGIVKEVTVTKKGDRVVAETTTVLQMKAGG